MKILLTTLLLLTALLATDYEDYSVEIYNTDTGEITYEESTLEYDNDYEAVYNVYNYETQVTTVVTVDKSSQ